MGVKVNHIKNKFLLETNLKVRTILPISLSYDHRIIDGAEAARFCNELRDNLGKNFAFKLADLIYKFLNKCLNQFQF